MLRLDWCFRMLLAALCGGIIGFERKSKAKNAGIRTHALIAVGAAMVMIISKYGFFDLIKLTHNNWAVDPSRIAAQVVSGIGFLGAGTIITRHDEIIDGLTTAAGIWVTGAIGLAYGSGLYSIGIIGTCCVLLTEVIGKYMDRFALKQSKGFSCFIQLEGNIKDLHAIIDSLDQKYFKAPLSYSIYDYSTGKISCQLYGELKANITPENVFAYLARSETIKSVDLE